MDVLMTQLNERFEWQVVDRSVWVLGSSAWVASRSLVGSPVTVVDTQPVVRCGWWMLGASSALEFEY